MYSNIIKSLKDIDVDLNELYDQRLGLLSKF